MLATSSSRHTRSPGVFASQQTEQTVANLPQLSVVVLPAHWNFARFATSPVCLQPNSSKDVPTPWRTISGIPRGNKLKGVTKCERSCGNRISELRSRQSRDVTVKPLLLCEAEFLDHCDKAWIGADRIENRIDAYEGKIRIVPLVRSIKMPKNTIPITKT